MFSLFSDHPASVGETYPQHFVSAMKFALTLSLGCLVCLIHAVLPFLFKTTGSRIIERLHQKMVTHRDRRRPAVEESPA